MIRQAMIMALTARALGTAAIAQDGVTEPQGVLVVLAHPDDELTMAHAIAALARQGGRMADTAMPITAW